MVPNAVSDDGAVPAVRARNGSWRRSRTPPSSSTVSALDDKPAKPRPAGRAVATTGRLYQSPFKTGARLCGLLAASRAGRVRLGRVPGAGTGPRPGRQKRSRAGLRTSPRRSIPSDRWPVIASPRPVRRAGGGAYPAIAPMSRLCASDLRRPPSTPTSPANGVAAVDPVDPAEPGDEVAR